MLAAKGDDARLAGQSLASWLEALIVRVRQHEMEGISWEAQPSGGWLEAQVPCKLSFQCCYSYSYIHARNAYMYMPVPIHAHITPDVEEEGLDGRQVHVPCGAPCKGPKRRREAPYSLKEGRRGSGGG